MVNFVKIKLTGDRQAGQLTEQAKGGNGREHPNHAATGTQRAEKRNRAHARRKSLVIHPGHCQNHTMGGDAK